jgi:hypothetical protein
LDHPEKQSTQKKRHRTKKNKTNKQQSQTKYEFLLGIKRFEDIKGAIRIRISTKNRQHNGQIKVQKDKQRRLPFYSYIQSTLVRVLAVLEGKKHT